MGNSFGTLFCVTTFGESHGSHIGCVIDGCPSGLSIDLTKIQTQLNRRRPGQSNLTSPRNEADTVRVLSGLNDGITLGSPIALIVENSDANPKEYQTLRESFRPSHADYTTFKKYGVVAPSGGGRSSARETVGRVAAGALAEQVLQHFMPDFQIVAWVEAVYDSTAATVDGATVTRAMVDTDETRCPDLKSAAKIRNAILSAKKDGDTVGGIISCVVRGVPTGLGSPVFDKLEADLAKAMLSIPACKGFEIGSGFHGTLMRGSVHNDPFTNDAGTIRTTSNHSGGVQGGISNGSPIILRAAFKPVSTLAIPQSTVTRSGEETTLPGTVGRHDPCVVPRAVPIVESMVALVLCDHFLRNRAIERR